MPTTKALQASDDPMAAPCWLPWRTGGAGADIVAQVGEFPSNENDVRIGKMHTPGLAEEVVQAHNACLRRAQESSHV